MCVGVYDGLTFWSGLIWIDFLFHRLVEKNGRKTVLYGLSYPQFQFWTLWDFVFWPYGKVGKDFVSGNNVCWNIVIVLQELLKSVDNTRIPLLLVDNTRKQLRYHCDDSVVIFRYYQQRETIIESLRFLKCVLSFISFVNISLGLILPRMCSTSTSLDWWHSQTIFYRRFRCLIPFEVTDAAHWTAALLSL